MGVPFMQLLEGKSHMMCKIRNWEHFQHYKDRNPPWVKLHFSLLTSQDWVMLDDTSRVLAIACMLVASRNEGMIDCSLKGLSYLRRVAYLNSQPDVNPLIECGFLEVASGCKRMLADARPETETETETEGDSLPREELLPPRLKVTTGGLG